MYICIYIYMVSSGADVAQRWCNGLPPDDLRFNSRWERLKTELHVLRKGKWDAKHN